VAVYGHHNNNNWGNIGDSNNGVYGRNSNDNMGGLGNSSYGAWGLHNDGNWGRLGTSNYGVQGQNDNGHWGHLGTSFYGVEGQHSGGNSGLLGGSSYGVQGQTGDMMHWGSLGSDNDGVYGEHRDGDFINLGYIGSSNHGVYGSHHSGNNGYLGGSEAGVKGNASSGYAGYFVGDAYVTNHLSKGTGSFKIDHPLDPENMYLYHSFVESPDMMNVYNGNVILDADGWALVELPDWFGALNKDYRYQLTCIGGFAPVFVEEEISGNRFRIAGGTAGMKVSWQVTGIRQDPLANARRVPVEEQKPPEERGYYMHPTAYGLSEARNVEWVRDPEMMRRNKKTVSRLVIEREKKIPEEENTPNLEHLVPVVPELKPADDLNRMERSEQTPQRREGKPSNNLEYQGRKQKPHSQSGGEKGK
jgi:hypothetical protein